MACSTFDANSDDVEHHARLMSTAFTIICLVWLASTVAAHVSVAFAQRAAKYDVFAVIPAWSFFAPNPFTTDLHLIYRDCTGGVSNRPFRELKFPLRGLCSFVWHPKRRVHKVLIDASSELLMLSRHLEAHELKITTPYLVLANYIIGLEVPTDVIARQFAIVNTDGFDQLRPASLMFLSEFHALPKRE